MYCLDFRMPPPKNLPRLDAGSVAARPPTLHIHQHDDPSRNCIESYIRRRYRERYGAHPGEWLPTLVSLQADGEILAAAGYRDAGYPLFLERYLAAPVEQYVFDQGTPVPRHLIVEAGHFAAMRAGAGRLLVPLLARHLRQLGFEWAVCTLTIELHHLFARMGLAHQPLSAATPDRLNAQERRDWGDYYTHAPQVFAGRLSSIVDRYSLDGQ